MTSHSVSSSGHTGVCTWWIAYTFDNPLRRLIHKPQKVLGNYVKEGMAVMDLGCGMGHFSIGMAGLVGSTGRVIAKSKAGASSKILICPPCPVPPLRVAMSAGPAKHL